MKNSRAGIIPTFPVIQSDYWFKNDRERTLSYDSIFKKRGKSFKKREKKFGTLLDQQKWIKYPVTCETRITRRI
ncbi:MAG: hypothetical protein U0U09_16555 [Cyclobacteriaceae bacterium]